MVIVNKEVGTNAFLKMKKVMEDKQKKLIELDLENCLCWYDLKNGEVLLINSEFGSSAELCEDLISACGKDSGVQIDEAHLTVQDMEDCGITRPLSYKDALEELKK